MDTLSLIFIFVSKIVKYIIINSRAPQDIEDENVLCPPAFAPKLNKGKTRLHPTSASEPENIIKIPLV